MKLITVPVGPIRSNAYFYYDEDTLEAVLIDCGDEADKLIAVAAEHRLTLQAILLTHGHYDHIGAVEAVQKQTGAPVFAGKNEYPLLEKQGVQAFGPVLKLPPENALADGALLRFAGRVFKVLFTPGHSYGSVCFYDEAGGILFTGDTLFYRSVGRTDFPTGSWAQMCASFRDVLFRLPKETIVYPGHGPSTAIGYEMVHNPEIRPEDLGDVGASPQTPPA